MIRRGSEQGFSLVEVMAAMMITGIVLMGTMGAVELSARQVRQGTLSTHALALAQARLEAKRSVHWQSLLEDDLDHDGVPETIMKDDGQGRDQAAGDGIFTAMQERDGVTLVWSIEPDRAGPLSSVGLVTIRATASFECSGGLKEVRMATLRANPAFVGRR
jgi:prepilin-type N-terminal cleavage/methylation domain-containing protein